jgi:hypothetical protein
VNLDGQPALTKTIDKESAPGGWIELPVDLSSHAGKTVLIEIIHRKATSPFASAYWAELDLKGAK